MSIVKIFGFMFYLLCVPIVKSLSLWHAIKLTFPRCFQVWNPFVSFSFKRGVVILGTLLFSKVVSIRWAFTWVTCAIPFAWS